MIRAEWTNNDALSAEQTTHSNVPNALNALDCISRKGRVMKNADKFKGIFGIYASELWAKSEKEFLVWLNEDVSERNVGKWKDGCCSECGYNWGNDAPIAPVPNFCPTCGAYIRKEDQN